MKVKAEKHPEIGDNDPVGDQVERPGRPAGKWDTGTLNITDWCRANGNRPESQLEPQL
jgi:hypothetical protein